MMFSKLAKSTRRVFGSGRRHFQDRVGLGAANHSATRVTTLPNGLRVATEKGSGEMTTLGVHIDTGSRYESEASNGVAHFLEHMFFKGTARRSRTQLEREIEDMGAHLNAFTSREHTVFYSNCFHQDTEKTIDILSDVILNSRIDEKAVEAERGVILREMQDVEKQVQEIVFDRLHETAYRGSSLGRTILGPVANIRRISRQDILDYIATHYTAPRIVITGAGNVDHQKVVDLVGKYFEKVPAAPPAHAAPRVVEPAKFVGSEIRMRADDMPVAHIAYSFETAGWTSPDSFALLLLQAYIGQWDNTSVGGEVSLSPFIRHIAKTQMAHSVTAFNTQYSDTGLFGVYAVAEPRALDDLFTLVPQFLTGICLEHDANLFRQAKNHLKMNLLYSLDNSASVAEEIGRQILTYGRRIHPTEALARVDALTPKDLVDVANKYFYDQDFALAAVGPIHELGDYYALRARTYSVLY